MSETENLSSSLDESVALNPTIENQNQILTQQQE